MLFDIFLVVSGFIAGSVSMICIGAIIAHEQETDGHE